MKVRSRIISVAGLMLLGAVFCAPAAAHSPHDDVFDVECSAASGDNGRFFAIVRSLVMVSDDHGKTWQRRVNGLDHKHMLVDLDVTGGGSTVFVVSMGDGVFVSGDGGETWRRANEGLDTLVLDVVAASPTEPGHALVAGVEGGLYRTTNGGESWSAVDGTFGKATAIVYPGDQSGHVLLGDHRGGLYRSHDGGVTWERAQHFNEAGGITAVDAASGDGRLSGVMVATASGRVFVSQDGLGTFQSVQVSSQDQPVVSLALSPDFARDRSVYASVWDEGVYFSGDGGGQWQRFEEGLTRHPQAEHLGRPSFADLCLSPDFSSDRTLLMAGFDGLFRSDDAGETWQEMTTISSLNIVALALSPPEEGKSHIALVPYLWGAFLSDDAGASWRPIYDGLLDHSRTTGITRLFNLDFSPDFNRDRTLFTSTWYRFYTSNDAGATWRKLPKIPLPEGTPPHHGSYFAVSPQFAQDGTVFAGTMPGFLLKSSDGAQSYQIIADLQRLIGSVVVSPAYGEDQTVFVGDTRGVHRSRDGGTSWEFFPLIDEGMFFRMPVSPGYYSEAAGAWKEHVLAQREKEYGIRLAISPDFGRDGHIFAGTPDGLMRSSDGGGSWERLGGKGLDRHAFVETVAVSPAFARDGTVLVSVRGRGLLRSTDRGETFSEAAELINSNKLLAHYPSMTPKFPAIVFSPSYGSDKTVYGFSATELLRSTDGGTSWENVHTPSPSLIARAHAWWRGYFIPWYRSDLIPEVSAVQALLLFLLALGIVGGLVMWVRRRYVNTRVDA